MILLVEDCVENRCLFAEWLVEQGFQVVAAEDGAEALEALGAARPDLILTDLMMPRLNGLEFIRQVRETPGLLQVPIVAMSAYGDDLSEARELGATAVFDKFQGFERLMVVINPLLDRSRLPTSA